MIDNQIRTIIYDWNKAINRSHDILKELRALDSHTTPDYDLRMKNLQMRYRYSDGICAGLSIALISLGEWAVDEDIPKDYADYHAPIEPEGVNHEAG